MRKTYKMNGPQMNNVLSSEPRKRYLHFLTKVADWQCAWGLVSEDGWVMSQSPEGKQGIPFWPHPEYADLCAKGIWSGAKPEAISLNSLLEKWLPGMSEDGLACVIFPTTEHSGIYQVPLVLKEELLLHCESYE